MDKKRILEIEVDNKKVKKVVLYLAAFFIPIAILVGILIYIKAYPFGDKAYVPVDANGQYSSFLQYFRSIFFDGESIFYSLGKLIGGEMYGLFAYYLASPYNLIVCLFPAENISMAFVTILILKTATASVTFTYFLNRKKEAHFTNLIFAICYSLSTYVITYGFNIMWLDGVILLPLILVGIENIVENKKAIMYIICLSLALITNYYIGFMICIFSVIYFIYKLVLNGKTNKKDILQKIGIFILCSIISAMIACVILVPVFTGLQDGRADFSFSSLTLDTNFNIREIASKFFTSAFDFDEIENDSMPPLFCGVLINVLVLLYFMNKKIKLKEKIMSFAVLIIFFVSFCIVGANLLWTMGNIPAFWEYRYAFAYIFMFILFAKRSFDNVKDGIDIKRSIIAIVIYIGVGAFAISQGTEFLSKKMVAQDIILAIIFIILLNLNKIKFKESKNKIAAFLKKHFTKIVFFAIFALNLFNITENGTYIMNIILEEGRLHGASYI